MLVNEFDIICHAGLAWYAFLIRQGAIFGFQEYFVRGYCFSFQGFVKEVAVHPNTSIMYLYFLFLNSARCCSCLVLTVLAYIFITIQNHHVSKI